MPKDPKSSQEPEENFDANREAIEALCRQSPNDTCNDCGASGTRWVSVNHGVFVCIRCSGVHRSIGSHVTKVKSTNLDKWTMAEINVMRQIGNARGKQLWESRFPKGQKPLTGSEPDAVVRSFIVQKYEGKAFADEEWSATLKRVYKTAGYVSGLKALKAAPAPSPTTQPDHRDFYDTSADAKDKKKDKKDKRDKSSKKEKTDKKEKKDKQIYGAFGLVTVSAALHDAKRAAIFAAFGLEEAASVEPTEEVAASAEDELQ